MSNVYENQGKERALQPPEMTKDDLFLRTQRIQRELRAEKSALELRELVKQLLHTPELGILNITPETARLILAIDDIVEYIGEEPC